MKAMTVAALGLGLVFAEGEARAEAEVWGGEAVTGCGWPTSVAVRSGGGLCTGTVVHERVVTYAAHCGAGNKIVVFGNSSSAGIDVATAGCYTYPGYTSQKNDWAFCVLAQPLPGLPVTPIVYGCEVDHYYKVGQPVAVAGFGNSTAGSGAGTKRWGMTEIGGIFNGYFSIGLGDSPSTCSGDSGGPVMVQYEDGTWHNLGIVSTGGVGCGGAGQMSFLPGAVPWIEETSGIDVTPCHDVDGTWNPGPDCTGFAVTGIDTPGEWAMGCPDIPASGPSGTCGQALGEEDDVTAPTVAVVSPADGAEYDAPATLQIELAADDVGWGLDEAWIDINDSAQAGIKSPPYVYGNVVLPEGVYTITGRAIDFAGNEATPDTITVYVGVEAPPPGESSTSESGETDAGTSGATATDAGSSGESDGGTEADSVGGDGEAGCGCRSGAGGSSAPWMLALLGVTFARRRRRR